MSKENQDTSVHFYSRANQHCPTSWLDLKYFVKQVKMPLLIHKLMEQDIRTEGELQERTILVVDDDALSLERHIQLIQSIPLQHRILEAHSEHEALTILKRTRPDLIVLNLQIPKANGFAVLDALQRNESLSPIPVIALTACIQTEADWQHLRTGVVTVLSKGVFKCPSERNMAFGCPSTTDRETPLPSQSFERVSPL